MSNLLESVPLRWVVAVVAFPIGGYLGHLIASPAATALPHLCPASLPGRSSVWDRAWR